MFPEQASQVVTEDDNALLDGSGYSMMSGRGELSGRGVGVGGGRGSSGGVVVGEGSNRSGGSYGSRSGKRRIGSSSGSVGDDARASSLEAGQDTAQHNPTTATGIGNGNGNRAGPFSTDDDDDIEEGGMLTPQDIEEWHDSVGTGCGGNNSLGGGRGE